MDEYDRDFEQAIALLEHYSFDIAGSSARGFATYWAEDLPTEWLRLAVLEALYQGRYKAVSVSQILAIWERKQQPQPHFNEEFERLICDRVFEQLEAARERAVAIASEPEIDTETTTIKTEPTSEVTAKADETGTDETGDESIEMADPNESRESAEVATETTATDQQRPHPKQIAQFVPEDSSPVYDKLRNLAHPIAEGRESGES